MSACDVGNHLGNEEGIVFGALIGIHGIISGLFLESVETTDAGGYNHAYAVFVDTSIFGLYSCVGHCLTGCNHGILCIEVELARFAAVEMILGFETLYFAGELGFEQAGIEMCDGAGSADARFGVLPSGGNIVAQRGDSSKAGNYDSFKFHYLTYGVMVCAFEESGVYIVKTAVPFHCRKLAAAVLSLEELSLLRVGFNESNGVADSLDLFSFFVGDSDAEFFFEVHDEFYGVEGVCTEVGDEACGFSYFFGLYAELIYHDVFYAICNF